MGQYLTFFIGGEEYAADILTVREIIEFTPLTRVPMTPPWVRGVMNLRGTVVPVVDLAVKFGLEECQPTNRTCIVVAEVVLDSEVAVFGLMADAVSQVIDLADEEIQPPPPFGTTVDSHFITGMSRSEDKLVLLLDIDEVLTSSEVSAVAALGRESESRPEPAEASAAAAPAE